MPILGNPIPLTVQLYDGATNMYPQAVLRDSTGTVLSTVNLTSKGLGFYQNNAVAMPNFPFVSATYIIYSDAGHSVPAGAYQVSSEVFELNEEGEVTNVYNQGFGVTGIVEGQTEQCQQQCPVQDTIIKGSDRTLSIWFTRADNGRPFDLTGYTNITFRFLLADQGVVLISSGDGSMPITVESAEQGHVLLELTAAQTALLQDGNPQPFQSSITIGGKKSICQFPTQVAVVDEYF